MGLMVVIMEWQVGELTDLYFPSNTKDDMRCVFYVVLCYLHGTAPLCIMYDA